MMNPMLPINALGRAGKGIAVSSYAAVDAYNWVSETFDEQKQKMSVKRFGKLTSL